MMHVTKRFDTVAVSAYADATGDRNPIHLDDEAARKAGLPSAIVPGMLPVAAAIESVRGASGDVVQLTSVRFLAPVLVGQPVEIHVEEASSDVEKNFEIRVDGVCATAGRLIPEQT